jgi:hypothetical protein
VTGDRRPASDQEVISLDPATVRRVAAWYPLLVLVLRPAGPMRGRDFDTVVIAVALALARAECRAGGRRGP